MIHSLIYFIITIIAILFTQIKHPLSIGFLLLIQTLLICLITGIIHRRFLFSYILFSVFLGGILLLFIYVTLLASNEIFNFSTKLFIINILLLSISIVIVFILKDNVQFLLINNNEVCSLNFNIINKENCFIINKLYIYPTNLISLLLINYLFFTLITAVKITNFYYGPLRSIN